MAKNEQWQDVNGYEGLYQVSNLGRVKSVGCYKCVGVVGHNRRLAYVKREKQMTPSDNGRGYMVVGLKKFGKRKNHYVHRLVAESFVENPMKKQYVNHKDYDIKNNNSDNLEWVTQKENVTYSSHRMRKPKQKFKKSNTGEKYISKQGDLYCVQIKQISVRKSFKDIKEAVSYRNEVLNENSIAI